MNAATAVVFIFLLQVHATVVASRTCPAVEKCLSALDAGKECPLLPVPETSLPGPIDAQGFNLTEFRPGVYSYNDGLYNSLILYKNGRLALIDAPLSEASVTPDGTYLLIPATKKVLRGRVPKRIDMVYGHRHKDHIGNAGLIRDFVRRRFPNVKLFIWGTTETRDFIRRPEMSRIPEPNIIVKKSGRTLELAPSLKVKLRVVGGHTNSDIAAHILPSRDGPGILHHVDVVTPGAVPFLRFALTIDLGRYVAVQKELLNLDFKFLTAGHGLLGTKRDMRINLKYTEFCIKAAEEAVQEADPAEVGRFFALRLDPSARQFGNTQFTIGGVYDLWTEICVRKMIERWGCLITGVDKFGPSHCTTALLYNTVDNQMIA